MVEAHVKEMMGPDLANHAVGLAAGLREVGGFGDVDGVGHLEEGRFSITVSASAMRLR